MDETNGSCPHCNISLIAEVERWSGYTKCPNCGGLIELEYDCQYLEEIGDEWDLWYFKKFDREPVKYTDDYFESKVDSG